LTFANPTLRHGSRGVFDVPSVFRRVENNNCQCVAVNSDFLHDRQLEADAQLNSAVLAGAKIAPICSKSKFAGAMNQPRLAAIWPMRLRQQDLDQFRSGDFDLKGILPLSSTSPQGFWRFIITHDRHRGLPAAPLRGSILLQSALLRPDHRPWSGIPSRR